MTFIQKWLNDFIRAYDRRTDAIKEGNLQILSALVEIEERLEENMATQEERLQGISAKIDTVLEMLATLKSNNPEIEDEIAEIEGKLSGAVPTPAPEPTPEPTPEPEPVPDPEG